MTIRLVALASVTALSSCGAAVPLMPATSGAAEFCAIEEPRRFTKAELDWRAANASENLRLDFKTNLAWDRECATNQDRG